MKTNPLKNDRYHLWYILLALCQLIPIASANDTLKTFIERVDTYQAEFSQVVINPSGEVIERAKGRFLLARPGRFRWDYTLPYQQQIIADGEKIWFYDVDLEQVTVRTQRGVLSHSPAALLAGGQFVASDYTIEQSRDDKNDVFITLWPQYDDATFQSIALVFSADNLIEMAMVDNFDQKTVLTFTDIVENRPLSEEMFRFAVQPGIDVIGDNSGG